MKVAHLLENLGWPNGSDGTIAVIIEDPVGNAIKNPFTARLMRINAGYEQVYKWGRYDET